MFPDLDPTPVHLVSVTCDHDTGRHACPVCGRVIWLVPGTGDVLVVAEGDAGAMHKAEVESVDLYPDGSRVYSVRVQ